MVEKFEDIDLDLEKMVFLCNAYEGNQGIYELTWELGYYNLSIEDKYKIAHQLLTELISNELVTLEKYTDLNHENKIETITKDETEVLLNNPSLWYPCNEIISIALTEKGEAFLNLQTSKFGNKLTRRLLNGRNLTVVSAEKAQRTTKKNSNK